MNNIIPSCTGKKVARAQPTHMHVCYNTPHADHMLFNCFRQSLISDRFEWNKTCSIPCFKIQLMHSKSFHSIKNFANQNELILEHWTFKCGKNFAYNSYQSSMLYFKFQCTHMPGTWFIFSPCLWIIQLNFVASSIILAFQSAQQHWELRIKNNTSESTIFTCQSLKKHLTIADSVQLLEY